MRRRALVLAYHNVVPDAIDGLGDRSLHLRRADFAAQLDALADTHDVVPLADLVATRTAARRPRAAITFDDAYSGAVTLGVNEVVARRLPATIFVAPAYVGGGSFWWDALADPHLGLRPDVRARALTDFRGSDAAVRRWAIEAGVAVAEEMHPVARVATEADVLAAAARPGITVGSHSWSHANLTRLSPDELMDELSKSLTWLRERLPNPLPWVTYPYGAFNSEVATAAARAGYEAALAINGGWVRTPPGDRFGIPRVNIPAGISVAGFQLRAAGFLCG